MKHTRTYIYKHTCILTERKNIKQNTHGHTYTKTHTYSEREKTNDIIIPLIAWSPSVSGAYYPTGSGGDDWEW